MLFTNVPSLYPSACLLKSEPVRYERVVECCQQVTAIQPGNVKGWYRLGLAHHNLRDFDAAKAALKEANQIAEGQGGYSFCCLSFRILRITRPQLPVV